MVRFANDHGDSKISTATTNGLTKAFSNTMDDSSSDDSSDYDPYFVCYTADDMLRRGMKLAGLEDRAFAKRKQASLEQAFVDRYGCFSVVAAQIWEDMQRTSINEAFLPINERDKVDYFFMSLHFLKRYPVESERALWYKCHQDTCRDWSWKFIKKIHALKHEKITWPVDNYGQDTWILTVDGVHCWCNEPKHDEFSMDPSYYSHKYAKSGYSYELAVSITESRLIWMKGPFKAGMNDKTIFREKGLCNKLRQIGKKGIADGGYYAQDLFDVLSFPNAGDEPTTKKFKRRAQRRHEVFNGMIKTFECLSVRFRHGRDKFKLCFEAVCVIGQYQMENGQPLYNVFVEGM